MARKNLKAKVLSVLEIIGFECADEDRPGQAGNGRKREMDGPEGAVFEKHNNFARGRTGASNE
jgi:hypothetical protein